MLENRASLETRRPDGITALLFAVIARDEEMVQLLVKAGANVNAKDSLDGSSPLHQAIYHNLNIEIIRLLLDHGADVDIRGDKPEGWTPLHIAATHGRLAAAAYLVIRGADLGAKDADGGTALHRPATSGEADMVLWLLDHGAEIEAERNDGNTALALAVLYGKSQAVEVLVQNGATGLDIRSMFYAAARGHLDVMRILKDHGAYINAQAPGGTTALHMAAEQNRISAVRFLCVWELMLGWEFAWQTALDIAVSLDHHEVARVLWQVMLSRP